MKWNFLELMLSLKISYIFSKESFSYISGNGTFLYFMKRKPPRNFLYFLKRKLFLYFAKWKSPKNSLYFRKWNFLAPKSKNLCFRRELVKPQKKNKKICSEEISCLEISRFAIFTAAKHREIPFEAKIQYRGIAL